MSAYPASLPPVTTDLSFESEPCVNIAELLTRAAGRHPSAGVSMLTSEQHGEFLSYPELRCEAGRITGGLRADGLEPGSNVILLLERPREIVPAFWGCVLGGYVPCIISPIRTDSERWARHLSHVRALLNQPLLVTTESLRRELCTDAPVADLHTLKASRPWGDVHEPAGTDPAILVLTSGSTGNSKAVVLTHANLLASMAGKAGRQALASTDVALNWIAFDHVAALLEIHMVAQYVGATQIHIEPGAILTNPLAFISLISRHRVTLAFAPNFLLGQINAILQSQNAAREELEAVDLSCLRHIVTGGEANVVATGRRFIDLLAPYGLRRDALRPAFGMTETSAASLYSHEFPDADATREFAAVGLPIDGFQVRIVDESGNRLPSGEPGELQVRGPMVFGRYYNNDEATRAAFTSDRWFRTGDLARVEDGRVMLVGRSKDSVIVSGVNYFCHELEAALEPLAGIDRSFVAAFPTRPSGADTEQLVVCFATTFALNDELRLHQLATAIRNTTVILWGFRPALILPLSRSSFPKTSLGKIQRALMRQRLEAGEFASEIAHVAAVTERQLSDYVPPQGPIEPVVAQVYAEIFGLDLAKLSATANFFELGGTSLDIIKLGRRLEERAGFPSLPLVHILQNPTIRALARLDGGAYDPIVALQLTGSKIPLFCVHPGVGEILIYVSLANYFVNDRPFYALRARGFNPGEKTFETLAEMVAAYVQAIRRRQPRGPYAIAGYSFGGPIAFEIAKVLEAAGESVAFIGCIDEQPFLAEPSSLLNGPAGPLHVAFLLGLIDREQLDELPHQLPPGTADSDTCEYIIRHAPPERLVELDFDLSKLRAWAALSRSLVKLGQSYEPSGSVNSMTVFFAQPLHSTRQEWLDSVRRWDRFTRAPCRYVDVAGEHHSLMGKQHVTGFQAILRAELDRALGDR